MDTYIITDGMGEFVRYYNHTGHVMQFTREREEAWQTTDSRDAYDVARIAQKLYRRPMMKMAMVNN